MHRQPHPLDNVVWSALTSVHAPIAIGGGLARHYPRDMAPFSALAEPSARAYADLREHLPPGLEARLFRPCEEADPAGWETLSVRPIIQMIADDRDFAQPNTPPGIAIEPLTLDDADDMLTLARIAEPGPVGARTVLLGRYVGVRDQSSGQLIAMAGERFCLPGYGELSAISVHPEARGRGLGRAVTKHLMRAVFDRGDVPFLHVFPDNPAALLYKRWGFCERVRLHVIWRRPVVASRT
jgi:ribosomal protein S18 acetylase RimI-like enzyme